MIKFKLSIALLMASSLPIGNASLTTIIESGDTSRVYDIDEVVVIDQPKEAFSSAPATIEQHFFQW